MRHRRRLLSDEDATREVWPAFTDVMSTLALILFVIVLLAYVRNLISSKRLDALARQIVTSQQMLNGLETRLRSTAAEIELGRAKLKVSEEKLSAQESIVADSNRELGELRSRLQGVAVLRLEVLNKLKQAMEAELRPNQPSNADIVRISDNGNIVINESLVFEYNSYAVKNEAKHLLQTLAKALGNVLADANVRENIDAIVIQGHTDERGSAAFNRDLSAKRANAVLDYMFDANPALATSYGSYFASSAFSKFRPINTEKSEAAYQQNRRIEISIVPKDANISKAIDDYMKSLEPRPAPP